VGFEYIIKRIERSTMYLTFALFSFIFSASMLPSPNYTIISMIVLIVDVSILGFIIVYILLVKSLCRKFHITVQMKKVFAILSLGSYIVYIVFIFIIAFFNHIQRSIHFPERKKILFYAECPHFVFYAFLFVLTRFKPDICKYWFGYLFIILM
jgi:hypothetical protein